ncbi:Carbohydrate esterase family 4 protein [Mycena kentingensis (nom. inval.)]|nr:Carbohydrate esterase family 4 protein [Mycena kentingensis (nom. inval.)]
MLGSLTLLSIPLLASAAAIQGRHDDHDHAHNVARLLPGQWYHDNDHPSHALFKRATAGATDGVTYPTVGTPEWAGAYPDGPPDAKSMPAEWLAALNDAVARKAIPSIPIATNTGDDLPTYGGLDHHQIGRNFVRDLPPPLCSASFGCRIPTDIWDAPDGHIAISFDDGPLPPTADLVAFLDAQNPPQLVTHFMIGINIIQESAEFTRAFERGDDMAVHTWSHRLMTTLSNEEVVAELGWTMEAIHNSTGGRVPKFWRPPQGNTDRRVSAIAKEVFGMHTVIWNQDTRDWSMELTPAGTTMEKIASDMNEWIKGPKSPGLVILEHELSSDTVQAFKSAFPLMGQNGWITGSLAAVVGNDTAYLNAATSKSEVVGVQNIAEAKNLNNVPAGGDAASASVPASTAGGNAVSTK